MSSETLRILDRMDRSETYMNVKLGKTESQSPSQDGLNCIYSELNFRQKGPRIDEYEDPPISSGPRELPTTAQTDCLTSTYTELNFRQEEPRIDEYEDPPISSGPSGPPTTAQTAQERKSEANIGNKPYRLICLLGVVMSALIVIVAGLSIHVSQIPQSQITCDREEYHEMNRTQRQCRLQVHELNSTLESTISENSLLNMSQRTCLQNLSALNSSLSELKRKNSDLRHQLTEMEKKYKTKAKICELLTSKREQTCPQNWSKNEDRCYFIFSLEESYDGARAHCSNFDASLLEINSDEEEEFVSTSIGYVYRIYWIGKCRDGNVASDLLYKMHYGSPTCRKCDSNVYNYNCNGKYRFICEKTAHLYPEIPEEIQSLCQHPVGPTSIT